MKTPNCTQLDSLLAMAPGEAFQDRDSWRKLAFWAEEQYSSVEAQRDELADAVRTLLNIEGPAKHGATFKAWHGLDVEWHFNKARAALAKLEAKK